MSASDDARLIREALQAGEILPAGERLDYSRSYVKDTARSEERTVVAINDRADAGIYDKWRPAAEMVPPLEERRRGESEGKTMHVVPYLTGLGGSPLARFAGGVELTGDGTVDLREPNTLSAYIGVRPAVQRRGRVGDVPALPLTPRVIGGNAGGRSE